MAKHLLSLFLILFSLLSAEGKTASGKSLPERFFGKRRMPSANAISNQLFKPGKSKNYFWLSFGPGSGNWVPSGGSLMTYTATGKLSTKIDTSSFFGQGQILKETHSYDSEDRETQVLYEQFDTQMQQWQNSYRITYSYDQIGLPNEFLYSQWLNGNWKLQGGYRDIRTFNSQNLVTGRTQSSYSATDSAWVNEGRTIDYQYNAQNHLVSYTDQEWDSVAYVNSEKALISYGTDNRPNEAVFQEWNGISFVDSMRITELQWYIWEGILETSRPLGYIEQKKAGNNWVNFEKAINSYLPNNSDIRLIQRFSGNQWVDYSRGSTIHDDQQYPVFDGDEEYNTSLSRWDTLVGSSYYTNYYDAQGRILEMITKRMEMISMPDQDPVLAWRNAEKKEFSQHQVFTSAGKPPYAGPGILLLQPNPVKLQEAFRLPGSEGSLLINDVQGREVLRKELTNGETVSVTGFNPGLYLLILQDRKGKISRGRLVVE